MSRTFTRDEIALMLEMRSSRKSFRAIGRALGCSRDAAQVLLGREPMARPVRRAQDTLAGRNIMHLVDIKRAGHSPRRTELNILPDGGAPLRIFSCAPLTYSLTGSPSATCAAEWGFGAK